MNRHLCFSTRPSPPIFRLKIVFVPSTVFPFGRSTTFQNPRAICPFCFSDKTVWEESSGEATVYTYSLMRKSPTGPYAIAYVTLKEGPSLQTNIVDCDLETVKIGQKVKVVWKPTDGAPLPFFTPA